MDVWENPYEQKLYQLFTSCDVDSLGSLDKSSLSKLCQTLELRDRETELIANLLQSNPSGRVTFAIFKEGLLNLLGGDGDGCTDSGRNDEHKKGPGSGDDVSDSSSAADSVTRTKLTTSTIKTQTGRLSPTREVSPKLVMGSKKYGRKTRPSQISISHQNESTQSSDSEQEFNRYGNSISSSSSIVAFNQQNITATSGNSSNNKTQKVQRSSSHNELNENSSSNNNNNNNNTNNNNKKRRPVSCTKLKRCASLPSQKPRRDDKVISSKTSSSAVDTIATTPLQRESSLESLDSWPTESSAVPSDVIIDMWTTAGITNAKDLLQNLGFVSKEIHISQLSLAIDDDLQQEMHVDNDTVKVLLKASLALHKSEVSALQQAFRQLADENRKLHVNNRDVNRRSAMLAQEVDERHAQLENVTKLQIQLLEQRHSETIKDLHARFANDREHWTSLNGKLEIRVKNLESDETKLRSEISTLQQENSALESDQINLQKQIADLLVDNKKLNYELVAIMDKHRDEENEKNDKQSEEVLQLIDKISMLQSENASLRDRNDEFASEIDVKTMELTKIKSKLSNRLNNISLIDEDTAADLSCCSTHKRRGDSPSNTKLTEESPKLGKLRKCTDGDELIESETSGEWMTLNSELSSDLSPDFVVSNISADGKDEEIKQLKERVAKLECELEQKRRDSVVDDKNINGSGQENIETLKERNAELELCLEQMRKEYEDCEDYWQGKLNEERQLFEEEQRITNEKFTELVSKMAEYEEQFALADEQNNRLSPIEEKCQLEQQYCELEAEAEQLKNYAHTVIEEKSNEIETLHEEIINLKHQLSKTMLDGYGRPSVGGDNDSPASSPISYLWHQSTIQAPAARDYHNPNWNGTSTERTKITQDHFELNEVEESKTISPIQRPMTPNRNDASSAHSDETSGKPIDAISNKSLESIRSVASTHSVHKSFPEILCSSPIALREDVKRLKLLELQLKDTIKELAQQRDCLAIEVEQLQEVKPMLAINYARTNHPSLMQKIQLLEQKNRQLINNAKQQQIYAENILQQTWQQQSAEINELRHRLEAQGVFIAEQAQRLTNADILVKDLYVENSQLNASVHRLEQQRNRNNLILQHQGLTIVPGMP